MLKFKEFILIRSIIKTNPNHPIKIIYYLYSKLPPFSPQWDAFSIPELRNFLRILDKEEDEQREAVIRRYSRYRRRLQEALTQVLGPS